MKKETLLAAALLLPLTTFAGELPVLKPEIQNVESIEEYEGLLAEGCSLGCAIGWSYRASSTLADQGNRDYAATNLGDGSLSTAWVEGAPGNGVGERISVTFAAIPGSVEEIPFNRIELVNGYGKSDAVWQANGRVKRMRVRLEKRPLFELRLADTFSPQLFNFDGVEIHPGDELEFEILEVYPGKKYADTAISEINLYGAH